MLCCVKRLFRVAFLHSFTTQLELALVERVKIALRQTALGGPRRQNHNAFPKPIPAASHT